MKINIICVGNLKEKFFRDASDEYLKRIQRFMKINVIELKEEKLREDNEKEEDRVKKVETNNILDTLKKMPESKNILLDVGGINISSVELSDKIKDVKNNSEVDIKDLNFIIGGSLGVDDELRNYVDFRLSFSKMTFPHQLMRIILLEQIYRAFKIMNGESYHK